MGANLCAQGIYRIEHAGFVGRVESKEYPDDYRERKCTQATYHSRNDIDEIKVFDERNEQISEQYSHQSSRYAEDDRFVQEEIPYVVHPYANRFQNANLFDPFGYSGKHDVHYANAGYYQHYKGYSSQEQCHGLCRVLRGGYFRSLVHDPKIIRIDRSKFVFLSEEVSDLRDGERYALDIPR